MRAAHDAHGYWPHSLTNDEPGNLAAVRTERKTHTDLERALPCRVADDAKNADNRKTECHRSEHTNEHDVEPLAADRSHPHLVHRPDIDRQRRIDGPHLFAHRRHIDGRMRRPHDERQRAPRFLVGCEIDVWRRWSVECEVLHIAYVAVDGDFRAE